MRWDCLTDWNCKSSCVMMLVDEARRFGMFLPRDPRSAVVLAGTVAEVGKFYPSVDAALRLRPGYRLVLAVEAAHVAEARRLYSHEVVLPLPRSIGMKRWWGRLDAALMIGPTGLARPGMEGEFVDGAAPITAAELAQRLAPIDVPAPPPGGRISLLDLIGARRIASVAELGARLGRPQTIICLGNGPSSEDRRLEGFRDATLFRVNWNWRSRDWMTAPQVVFTADPDLPSGGARPVIVLPTIAVGRPILLRHAMRLRPPEAYVFLDRFDPRLADLSGPVIPTNGALMIAVAAALRPKRLVIAGMDLYQHPGGRYPGDTVALDGYSREHSLAVDIGLIRAALASFTGEVVNLSDNLRTAL